MPLARLPKPQPFPPISLDGGAPIPIRGWRNGDRVFAFAVRPVAGSAPERGKWYAVELSISAGKPVHSWPCDTSDEAQGIAAQDYAKSLGIAKPDIYVQDTKDHLN